MTKQLPKAEIVVRIVAKFDVSQLDNLTEVGECVSSVLEELRGLGEATGTMEMAGTAECKL